MRRWWYKRILTMILIMTVTLSSGFYMAKIESDAEKSRMANSRISKEELIVGGFPIGIYMEMDGVLVLETEQIKNVDGTMCEPAKNLVKSGDYIVELNGEEIENKKDLVKEVNQLDENEVILGLRREGELIEVKMEPVEVSENEYKLGIWVKDNIQGLGTVTYVKSDGKFGALGHGIHDSDTGELIEIECGTVYKSKIVGIQKGVKGEPGGLEGVIVYTKMNKEGRIDSNTENGIFGKIENIYDMVDEVKVVAICPKKEIELGEASICCTVDGKVEEYKIKIKNVDFYTANVNKGIMIEVIDERLLELTGGIVQGMSGSPILQNGKIVGAVTHVLVNDPSRGYGIFIEDMLEMKIKK